MNILNEKILDSLQKNCCAYMDNPLVADRLKKVICDLGADIFVLQCLLSKYPELIGYSSFKEYAEKGQL